MRANSSVTYRALAICVPALLLAIPSLSHGGGRKASGRVAPPAMTAGRSERDGFRPTRRQRAARDVLMAGSNIALKIAGKRGNFVRLLLANGALGVTTVAARRVEGKIPAGRLG